MDVIQISTTTLSADDALQAVGFAAGAQSMTSDDDEAGALVLFSGVVRAREGEGKIEFLDYEHYEGMAERETQKLIEAARTRWPLQRVAVLHRVGRIAVGETSVIIAVSAGHRAEAFDAARFLIDELKKSVPIWKRAPTP